MVIIMIKKLSIILFAVSLCIAALMLSGCTKEAPLSLSYEEKVSVQFLDPSGYSWENSLLGYGTEYKGISYKFARALTE